jgi:hypothetical protein
MGHKDPIYSIKKIAFTVSEAAILSMDFLVESTCSGYATISWS